MSDFVSKYTGDEIESRLDKLGGGIDAQTLNNRQTGVNNNNIPYYISFPGASVLKNGGYLDSNHDSLNTESFFKGLCKWAIDNYKNKGRVILQGYVIPNSGGFCNITIYSDNDIDDEGYPHYLTGVWYSISGEIVLFGTNNYKWHWDRLNVFPLSKKGVRHKCMPYVADDGVMEVGRIIDFHYDNNDEDDKTGRIYCTSDGTLKYSNSDGTDIYKSFAFIDSNVEGAKRLLSKFTEDIDLNDYLYSDYVGQIFQKAGGTHWENAPSIVTDASAASMICLQQSTYIIQILFSSANTVYHRFGKDGAVVNTWKEFAFTNSNNIERCGKLTTKLLAANTDLNELKDDNFATYYANGAVTSTVINKPSEVSSGAAFGLHVARSADGYRLQYLFITAGIIYFRAWTGSVWTEWRKIATVDGEVAKLTTKQLTNEDLNDIKDMNFSSYYANDANTCANKPSGITAFGLQVYRVAGGYFSQILTAYATGATYKRNTINPTGTWTPWKKMLTEDDLPKEWIGTEDEYNALTTKDPNTTYYIKEEI